MELLQLQYFKKVAEMGNITKAAKTLHIAQPSLSKTISRLEEQIGVKLFERTGKRIQLNEFGKCFLERVNHALSELEDGVNEVRDLASQKEKCIAVGSATAKMLPNLMKTYLIKEPETKLKFLQVTQHSELLQLLEQGDIDICISSLPLKKKKICCKPLTIDRIYLVVPRDHSFANRKEITLKEIGKEPLIAYTAECGLHEIIKQFFGEADFEPNISCECTTPEVTCNLVDAGLGLAFLPEYLSDMEYTKSLSWIPVTKPNMERTIWISWNKERYQSQIVCDFRDFVSAFFSSK